MARLLPDSERPPGEELISRRSPEYMEHVDRWNFLLDSLEGGNRYRFASYGEYQYEGAYDKVVPGEGDRPSRTVSVPYRRSVRRHNLIRHPREYPDPRDARGGVDAYELRRERTPIPTILQDVVDKHLSRVYSQEVGRDGPDELEEWWNDVDGAGTSIDAWMSDEIAPILLSCGQIDLVFDHPRIPEGEDVVSKADVKRLGLDRCVASYYLPENVLWWKLDDRRRYLEVLVREAVDKDVSEDDDFDEFEVEWRYRHWYIGGWTLYDDEGNVVSKGENSFGVVPIVRVFDRRKPRCKNVGQSRYESIAERQREIYNLSSELILANTTQAFPLLSGPEKYLSGDSTIPIGPNNILPIWMSEKGERSVDWKVINFPKDGVRFIHETMDRQEQACDKTAALQQQTTGVTGLAKFYEYRQANDLLSKISATLARCERAAAEMALVVLSDGQYESGDEDISVTYPSKFDLQTADELGAVLSRLQQIAMGTGSLPEVEKEFLRTIVRLALPGRTDDEYAEYDNEIDEWVDRKAEIMPQIIVPPGSPGVLGPGGGGVGDRGGTSAPAVDQVRVTPEAQDLLESDRESQDIAD